LSTLPSSERHLADDGESVLVLFANRENRALMSDMLRAAGYGVSSVFPPVSGRPADVRDFDLCIVDGPSLNEYWDRLLAVQAQQQPVPLPVLFFSDRRDVGLTTRNLWHVVDDVVERPVDKLTLRAGSHCKSGA
jgi:DNA-binding response OmpR family regulator